MEWQIVIALIIAIPVILFPIGFVWFLNIGGMLALRESMKSLRKHGIKENL